MKQDIERGQNSRTVEYLMSRNIIFMEVSACTACNAANRMVEMKVGSIILTNNTKPVGIITEHDLVKNICASDLLASNIPSESIMSSPIIMVDKRISVKEAANEMIGNNVRHLLVQDSAAHDILGIVTSLDIMNYFKYEGDLEEYAKWESLPTDNSLQKKLDEQC